MDVSKINSLNELQDLFWQNKSVLGEEEQRLFQCVLIELAKGGNMDKELLAALLTQLGQRMELIPSE